MDRPKSVILGRDPEVLQTLLDFYARPKALVIDVTCNQRRMWKGVKWSGKIVYCDINPKVKPDVTCDFRALPFSAGRFDVVVFDPPHLPSAAASPKSFKPFVKREGLDRSLKGDNIAAFFPLFLKEAHRILKPDGLIFSKLSDYVHNHKYQWVQLAFVEEVRKIEGLTPCDLIIKRDPCGGNLKSGRWQKAHHARRVHVYWTIVRKGKCEPKHDCGAANVPCSLNRKGVP